LALYRYAIEKFLLPDRLLFLVIDDIEQDRSVKYFQLYESIQRIIGSELLHGPGGQCRRADARRRAFRQSRRSQGPCPGSDPGRRRQPNTIVLRAVPMQPVFDAACDRAGELAVSRPRSRGDDDLARSARPLREMKIELAHDRKRTVRL
jgi:hypothetical protein